MDLIRASLDDVSFSLAAGEFVCIWGASGSGKRTLLNILGGLDRPTDGSYRYAGMDVSMKAPDELSRLGRSEIGMISQADHLIDSATGTRTHLRRRDILRQFLVEAVAVTFAGGVLGTALGFASRFAFEAFEVPAGLSPWFVFAALGCAVATGLAAGIVPARRAAGLDPVAALAR